MKEKVLEMLGNLKDFCGDFFLLESILCFLWYIIVTCGIVQLAYDFALHC